MNGNNNNHSPNQKQKTISGPQSAAAPDLKQDGIDFSPSSEEVARRAYFSYLNEDSRPGRDVQHWLEAEAQVLAERNLTRVHGFHNRT
jgi:hypothetical protein